MGEGRIDYEGLAANALLRARQQLSLTLPDMAEALSTEVGWAVTKNALSAWEQPKRPRVPAAILIASAKLVERSPVPDGNLHALVYSRAPVRRKHLETVETRVRKAITKAERSARSLPGGAKPLSEDDPDA